MKLATLLVAIALAGLLMPLFAADPAAGEVVIGFTGGASWKDAANGACIWHFPVVANQDLASLFAPAATGGAPVPDRDHSYLIWVSDFAVEPLPSSPPQALALVPAGTATIYFRPDPTHRNFDDRSTWGAPIATFTRKTSIIRSPDAFASDTFIFTADLVSTMPFIVNGRVYDFRNLIPNGMTCFEYGQGGSSWESGVCTRNAKQ